MAKRKKRKPKSDEMTILLRLGPRRHRQAAEAAKREGVSLNEWIIQALLARNIQAALEEYGTRVAAARAKPSSTSQR